MLPESPDTMEQFECDVCHDCGYLDINTFCDCNHGVFYEERYERTLMLMEGELDIGQVSDMDDANDSGYYGAHNYDVFDDESFNLSSLFGED